MARRLLKISKEETPQPPGSLCQCCHPHRTEVLLVSRGLCLLPPVLPEGTTKRARFCPPRPPFSCLRPLMRPLSHASSRLHSPSSPLLLTAEELQALCHLDGPTCLSYWEPRTGPSTPGAASAAQSRGEEPLLLTRCRYSASHSREPSRSTPRRAFLNPPAGGALSRATALLAAAARPGPALPETPRLTGGDRKSVG